MLSLIPFTVCAFLALIASKGGNATPSTISLQCSANDVCAALETLTRRQDHLQKTLNLCTDDESQFTLTAAVKCTSVIQLPFPNRHFKMAALDLSSGICRALAQPIVASQAYTVSAEILNEAGWRGVNSGHPGLLFNAIDENNFDFVYLRPHSVSGCYQTGYMSAGVNKFVESKRCPNGPPKGGEWFPFSVTVNGQYATVYRSGVLVTTFKTHFASSRARGGVFIFNGYKNVILFRKFKTAPKHFFSKRCKEVVEFPAGYVKMDAGIGSSPRDAFCQVEFGSDGRIASYELKVDLYNFIGRDKANLGHPGVFFNAEDEDNYDFVYFRPHSVGRCFQTGYLLKGKPRFDGAKSASCPKGPPKGKTWFNVKLTVSNATPAGEVRVYLDDTLVTSFNPRYPIKRRGGVLVANGYKNVIYFRNFKIL